MSDGEISQSLKAGKLSDLLVIRPDVELKPFSLLNESVLEDKKGKLSACSGSAMINDNLDPFCSLVMEFKDVLCHDPPSVLPPDRGVRHDFDLVPENKYCVTGQWPLPKEQRDVIDDFFRAKHSAGMVRERKSTHPHDILCQKA